MPFDYRAAGVAANGMPGDLRAMAKNDPEMRKRMVTERARNWYRGYMGAEPPAMRQNQNMGIGPAAIQQPQNMAVDPMGQELRGLLAQLRNAGVIA